MSKKERSWSVLVATYLYFTGDVEIGGLSAEGLELVDGTRGT